MNIYWSLGWFIGYVLEVLIQIPLLVFSFFKIIINLLRAKYIFIKANISAKAYDDLQVIKDIIESKKEKLIENLTEEEIEVLELKDILKNFTGKEKRRLKKRTRRIIRAHNYFESISQTQNKEQVRLFTEEFQIEHLHLMNPDKFPPSKDKK